jgi:nucleotidyltransferase/DNA polymerase involved in DNA repair
MCSSDECAGQLSHVPLQHLQRMFGDEEGATLHDLACGRDHDTVKPRLAPKSIGCGKSFTGHLQIKTASKVSQPA